MATNLHAAVVAVASGQTAEMWFEALTGFREDEVGDTASLLTVDDDRVTSKVNGRTMRYGRFETPTLGELRERCASLPVATGGLRLREVVADVQQIHADPANAGALFQVASQFNTLEMVSPSVTPEQGIDRYETDLTQGPACAVACGAGTIYRNYLVPLDGGRGQTADRQIECLADLTAALGVEVEMRNGYALPTAPQLSEIHNTLIGIDGAAGDALMAHLRIGLQHDTEVTLGGVGHLVTQAYCSALPVAYASHSPPTWEPFARLVLDAAYEATFCAGVLNAEATGNRTVYLTLLGGGAFGNPTPWILDAIQRAVTRFADVDVDVAIVSFGSANPSLQAIQ